MPSCCVCHSSPRAYDNKRDKITIHRFPSRQPVKDQWKTFAGVSSDANEERLFLCSRHFKRTDFTNNGLKKLLWKNAVPCFYSSGYKADNVLEKARIPDCPEHNIKLDIEEDSIEDFSRRDHDYLGSGGMVKKWNISETNEKLLENKHSQQVLEYLKKELCRICGQKGDDLTPICETTLNHATDELPLSAKIEMHLPLKVDKDDKLPLHVCLTCFDLLNRWHELYVTCVAAGAVLRKTFGIEEGVVPSDSSLNNFLGRAEDKALESVICNLPTKENAQDEKENCSVLEPHEDRGGVCEKCGNSKDGEAKEEKDEFENFFQNSEYQPSSILCKLCRDPFRCTVDRRNHFIMCRQLSTICDICGVEVTHRKDLPKHKSRKHGPPPKKKVVKNHPCDKCAKSFYTNQQLKGHKALHERGPTPKHFCKLCCKTFLVENGYDIHMKKHEKGKVIEALNVETFLSNDNNAVYVCPVCQQIFQDALSFAIHLTSKTEMKCPMCHKKILNERRFILHKCNVWSCQYCFKSFYGKFECENHERIHTGEKPFKCSICDAMFRTASLKVHHERTHIPVLFKCPTCNKQFRNKSVFRDHLNCHMGYFLSCKDCDKKFSSRKSLRKHVKIFHINKELLK